MYSRKLKERKAGKVYESYRLVESVRIDNKPRQRTILNLGADFGIPVERFKELCGMIEEKLMLPRQSPMIPREPNDSDLVADSIVQKIIVETSEADNVFAKETQGKTPADQDFVSIDLNSIENGDIRSVGGEAVCLETVNRLEVPKLLGKLGFNTRQKALAIGSVVARLLAPGSDRSSFRWLQETSALGEVKALPPERR